MPGRRAGSPIVVYARVQCREPETGQQKVQFYSEDNSLFLSSYYLSIVMVIDFELTYARDSTGTF